MEVFCFQFGCFSVGKFDQNKKETLAESNLLKKCSIDQWLLCPFIRYWAYLCVVMSSIRELCFYWRLYEYLLYCYNLQKSTDYIPWGNWQLTIPPVQGYYSWQFLKTGMISRWFFIVKLCNEVVLSGHLYKVILLSSLGLLHPPLWWRQIFPGGPGVLYLFASFYHNITEVSGKSVPQPYENIVKKISSLMEQLDICHCIHNS